MLSRPNHGEPPLTSTERSPDNLIWIDLEFTNLEPTEGAIMQAAMVVTQGDLTPIPPPGIPSEVGGLLFDVQLSEAQAAGCSAWVKQNQADQLKRSQGPEAVPVAKVEELFVAYLLSQCEVPENKRIRPLLAGNSVHGDARYLAVHMPKLHDLLSFRILDVTTIKELARRWCPKLEFTKNHETIRQWYPAEIKLEGEAHDALYDIKGSIAELAFYRATLFGPAARGEKKSPSLP